MTAEEIVARMESGQAHITEVVNLRYDALNAKIDGIRADLHQHRVEAAAALASCNSRIDTLTTWMISGLGAALLALFAAVASWFSPRPH